MSGSGSKVCDSLCQAAAAAQDSNAQYILTKLRVMAIHSRVVPRSTSYVPGSGSECAGRQRAACQHAARLQHAAGHGQRQRSMPEVFDSLWQAAAATARDFNAQYLSNALLTRAVCGGVMPEVYDYLCQAAAANVHDFNAQNVFNTLLVMTILQPGPA